VAAYMANKVVYIFGLDDDDDDIWLCYVSVGIRFTHDSSRRGFTLGRG